MLFDGFNVLRTGKYFGPDLPGPWRRFPETLGIDPFAMGPIFVALGFAWIVSASAVLAAPQFAFWFLIIVSISTLWFISVGTAISLLTLLIVLVVRPLS